MSSNPMLQLIEKVWNPIKSIFTAYPSFDPRNDPELREVARRQDIAVRKIVRKKGVANEEEIFDALIEESWASPDDYSNNPAQHEEERTVMRDRLRRSYKGERHYH